MVLIFPHDQGAWRPTSKGNLTPCSTSVFLVGSDRGDVIKVDPNLIAVRGGQSRPSWHRRLHCVGLSIGNTITLHCTVYSQASGHVCPSHAYAPFLKPERRRHGRIADLAVRRNTASCACRRDRCRSHFGTRAGDSLPYACFSTRLPSWIRVGTKPRRQHTLGP
jgi:hypothetical protein